MMMACTDDCNAASASRPRRVKITASEPHCYADMSTPGSSESGRRFNPFRARGGEPNQAAVAESP